MSRLNSRANAEDLRHRELLARSADGSTQAFSQLYDLLYTPLVRFIFRYTRTHAVIEDILNDTMLVVWQKAGTFRGDSRVMTWILGIASRRALKALHREKSWIGACDYDAIPHPTPGDSGRLATLEALEWALGQLGREQRLVLELAYFHGMTCEEIAEILECPVNTAKTRLFYGRRKLRAIFTEHGEALEFSDLIDEAGS